MTNNKSIAQYNVAIQKVQTKSRVLVGLEWVTFGQDGVERRQKGAYFICYVEYLLARTDFSLQDIDYWE